MTGGEKDLSPRQARIALLALWAGTSILMVVLGWQRIVHRGFFDPDDVLRLVQVRDWLAGQSWFDTTQYRIHPPQGTSMHWSRLVDLPLAAGILLLQHVVSPAAAERITLAVVPLLTGLVLTFASYGVAFSVTGRRITGLCSVLITTFTISLLVLQFQPMRIDHHAWQIALQMVAVMLVFRAPASLANAVGAALAAAAAVTISIECLPMAAALAGILTLRMLRKPPLADHLIAYMAVLALGSLVLHFATLGWAGGGLVWCDAMSPAYLAPLVSAGATLVVARPLLLGSVAWRVAILFCLVPAAAATAFVIFGPECLNGPFAALDPFLLGKWYGGVSEGLPFWRLSADSLLLSGIPVALGLAGTLLALRFDAAERRRGWIEMLLVLGAASLVALMLYRAFGLAIALAAPGNAWLLLAAFDAAMRRRSLAGRLSLGTCCILLMPWMGPAAMGLRHVVAAPDPESRLPGPACSTADEVRALDALPKSLLFTPIDMGAEVIAQTPHSVVATSHHRNTEGLRAVLMGFMAPAGEAQKIIASTGSRYVVYCDSMAETRAYAQEYPGSLGADLAARRIPPWLRQVLDTPAHLTAYEVLPAAGP